MEYLKEVYSSWNLIGFWAFWIIVTPLSIWVMYLALIDTFRNPTEWMKEQNRLEAASKPEPVFYQKEESDLVKLAKKIADRKRAQV